MDKKKPQADSGDMPERFEILPQVSSVKTMRERDNRVQAASSLSVLLSLALLVSVGSLVYRAITAGEYDHYAQDLRTGAFTELQAVPDSQRLTNYKTNPPPSYNEKKDIEQLEAMLAERRRLNSLFDPKPEAVVAPETPASAPDAQIAPNQPASAASAP